MDEPQPQNAIPDPRVPDDKDWGVRPFSESEHYVEPGIEAAFVRDWPAFIPQVPSLLGVSIALFGFLPGGWGIAASVVGLGLSALGIATPGATHKLAAWGGFFIAIAYLLVHAVAPQ